MCYSGLTASAIRVGFSLLDGRRKTSLSHSPDTLCKDAFHYRFSS